MWCLIRLFLLVGFFLSSHVSAGIAIDSTIKVRLQNLAKKMHLKTPKLAEGDYEVRIWNECGLCFGDAHELYRLIKNRKTIRLSKYNLRFNKNEFIQAKRTNPAVLSLQELWNRLMQQSILTLPDQSAIYDELHPKPQKDSTWNIIETDGSISVKAKRKAGGNVIISDGESYYFEVFGTDTYRIYEYGNPREYVKYKPNIVELRHVNTILDEIASVFYSSK